MTNPTPLSPAAQAVLDAANTAYDNAATVAQGTAAALRAAALSVDWESGDPKFLVLAIAAELEGAD